MREDHDRRGGAVGAGGFGDAIAEGVYLNLKPERFKFLPHIGGHLLFVPSQRRYHRLIAQISFDSAQHFFTILFIIF